MTTAELTPVGRRFHPACLLLPEIAPDEFRALVEDIKARGQRHPIVTNAEGLILDGRHRALACDELGIEPKAETFTGSEEEAIAMIMSENVHRRHLTTDQRAAVAAELAKKLSEAARARQLAGVKAPPGEKGKAADRAARMVGGVSRGSVENAIRRMREDPKAHEAAKRGERQRKRAAPVAREPERTVTPEQPPARQVPPALIAELEALARWIIKDPREADRALSYAAKPYVTGDFLNAPRQCMHALLTALAHAAWQIARAPHGQNVELRKAAAAPEQVDLEQVIAERNAAAAPEPAPAGGGLRSDINFRIASVRRQLAVVPADHPVHAELLAELAAHEKRLAGLTDEDEARHAADLEQELEANERAWDDEDEEEADEDEEEDEAAPEPAPTPDASPPAPQGDLQAFQRRVVDAIGEQTQASFAARCKVSLTALRKVLAGKPVRKDARARIEAKLS